MWHCNDLPVCSDRVKRINHSSFSLWTRCTAVQTKDPFFLCPFSLPFFPLNQPSFHFNVNWYTTEIQAFSCPSLQPPPANPVLSPLFTSAVFYFPPQKQVALQSFRGIQRFPTGWWLVEDFRSGVSCNVLPFCHRNAVLGQTMKTTPQKDKKIKALFQSQDAFSPHIVIDINVLCARAHMVPPQCHSIHLPANNRAYCDLHVNVSLEWKPKMTRLSMSTSRNNTGL